MSMKRFITVSICVVFSLSLFAQFHDANEVSTTFSSKNLFLNHTEFDFLSSVNRYAFYELPIGKVESVKLSKNDKELLVNCDENGQIVNIHEGHTINPERRFVYNTKSLVEAAFLGNYTVAITYDKKGNVVSEAFLVKSTKIKNPAEEMLAAHITMFDSYICTDQWKKQQLTDSTESVYMYESMENGEVVAWVIDKMFVYDYNSKGLMTQKVESSRDKVRESVVEFTYKNGVLTQQVKTYSNTNMIESTMYSYEKGLLTKAVKGYYRYAAKRKVMELSTETNQFVYNENGKLIEFTSNSGQRYDYCSMQYDANNRITEVQKRQENGEMVSLFKCEYDKNNMIIKSEKNSVVTTYQYEYDSVGNWTKQTVTKNNGTPVVTTREFVYKK